MKFKIDFTQREKRKLWKAGISLKKLDDCSLRQLLDAVAASPEREREIRAQFDQMAAHGLAKVLDLRHLSGVNGLIRSNLLINSPSYRAAIRISERYDMLLPRGLLSTMNHVAGTKNVLDNLNGLYPFLPGKNNLAREYFSSKKVMDNFPPINERLQGLAKGLKGPYAIERNSLLNWNGLFSKADQLAGLGRAIDRSTTVGKSLLQQERFLNLNIGGLAKALAENSGFERSFVPGMGTRLLAASTLTRLAEANLGAFQWESLASRVRRSLNDATSLRNSFLDVSERYGSLLGNIAFKPNWVYEAPDAVEVASEDFYIGSKVLKIVSNEDAIADDTRELDQEIDLKNTDAIGRYLPVIDKGLPDLWTGAVLAMGSDNPDRVRHMITSLRELYTHVLHRLAPDYQMDKWDLERKHYYENRPTRRGRFMYICRNLEDSQSQFGKLLKSEVDATLAMIELFNGGTHSIKSVFDDSQLMFIKIKAETTLRTFLTIEFEINRKH